MRQLRINAFNSEIGRIFDRYEVRHCFYPMHRMADKVEKLYSQIARSEDIIGVMSDYWNKPQSAICFHLVYIAAVCEIYKETLPKEKTDFLRIIVQAVEKDKNISQFYERISEMDFAPLELKNPEPNTNISSQHDILILVEYLLRSHKSSLEKDNLLEERRKQTVRLEQDLLHSKDTLNKSENDKLNLWKLIREKEQETCEREEHHLCEIAGNKYIIEDYKNDIEGLKMQISELKQKCSQLNQELLDAKQFSYERMIVDFLQFYQNKPALKPIARSMVTEMLGVTRRKVSDQLWEQISQFDDQEVTKPQCDINIANYYNAGDTSFYEDKP